MKNSDTAKEQPRPFALLGLLGSGILAGAVFGGTTNAVNGLISPSYFTTILGWEDVTNVWRASIAQGIFEGLLYGLFFSLIFAVVVGIVSKLMCSYEMAVKYLLKIAFAVYGCWIAGGLIAVGLSVLSPEFYRHTFIGVPDSFTDMIRYAWVGGSILGAILGGLVSVIVGSIIFRSKWNQGTLQNMNPQPTMK